MALTNAQLTTLKADIIANGLENSSANAIAEFYNAASTFTVWKTNVSINEVGKKFNGAELAGLTTGNQTRLLTLAAYLAGGVNPSLADNRAFFDDVFSGAGGATTRAALLSLWKRIANKVEKLFATGTGTDAVPGLLTFEGSISEQDATNALRS
jgi:hypothetical protein